LSIQMSVSPQSHTPLAKRSARRWDCSSDGADATAAYPLNGRLRWVTTKSTRRLRQFECRQCSPTQRHVASAIGDQRRQIRVPVPQTAATRQQDRDIPHLAPSVALPGPAPSATHDKRRLADLAASWRGQTAWGFRLANHHGRASGTPGLFERHGPCCGLVDDRLPAGDIVPDQRYGLVVRHPADKGAGPVADHRLGLRATPEADESAVARGGGDASDHVRRL
jgi:hypothetical protein